jgi:transcriptional regulator with XRE-family HTH domain
MIAFVSASAAGQYGCEKQKPQRRKQHCECRPDCFSELPLPNQQTHEVQGMMHLGQTARLLRERNGLTQKAAADALGITQVHLSNIENNKSIPSTHLLDRYREIWDVDLYILAWCLFGDPSELPRSVRKPMMELGKAWKRELGDLAKSAAR